MATDMEPGHGRLWIYDTDDQQTVAFTPDGMEYLREMLRERRAWSANGSQTEEWCCWIGRRGIIFGSAEIAAILAISATQIDDQCVRKHVCQSPTAAARSSCSPRTCSSASRSSRASS